MIIERVAESRISVGQCRNGLAVAVLAPYGGDRRFVDSEIKFHGRLIVACSVPIIVAYDFRDDLVRARVSLSEARFIRGRFVAVAVDEEQRYFARIGKRFEPVRHKAYRRARIHRVGLRNCRRLDDRVGRVAVVEHYKRFRAVRAAYELDFNVALVARRGNDCLRELFVVVID